MNTAPLSKRFSFLHYISVSRSVNRFFQFFRKFVEITEQIGFKTEKFRQTAQELSSVCVHSDA